jgi:hypothetical protein
MLIHTLEDAIYAKAVATSAITTAFPGTTVGGITPPVAFFSDLAIEGTALPFIVQTVIATPSTLKYGGVQRSECRYQFAIYAGGGKSAALLKAKTFTDVFDDLILTLATGKNVNTMRMNEPMARLESRDANGNEVWQATVEYEFVIAP